MFGQITVPFDTVVWPRAYASLTPNTLDLNRYILPEAGKRAPDIVISTHPDSDHIGGLHEIVEYYQSAVGEVWVRIMTPRYLDVVSQLVRRS